MSARLRVGRRSPRLRRAHRDPRLCFARPKPCFASPLLGTLKSSSSRLRSRCAVIRDCAFCVLILASHLRPDKRREPPRILTQMHPLPRADGGARRRASPAFRVYAHTPNGRLASPPLAHTRKWFFPPPLSVRQEPPPSSRADAPASTRRRRRASPASRAGARRVRAAVRLPQNFCGNRARDVV